MGIITGPTNSILDAGGLKIGQAHDKKVKTGVTVILPDEPATCAVDVRGGGPGTRETDSLGDSNLVNQATAITLAGGSVYGLAAADGVAAWLGDKKRGYVTGPEHVPVSPIVPSAIIFDNANGGDKDWGINPPFRGLGFAACNAVTDERVDLGRAGAGFGASAGLYSGGIGTASEVVDGITIAALIVANPVGSPFMPGTTVPWAWPYEVDGEFGGERPSPDYVFKQARDTKLEFLRSGGQATIIGVIATDAKLGQKALRRLAVMAQCGMPMAVQPAHSPFDGDTIFAMSTGDKKIGTPPALADIGAAGARCVARAIMRGIYEGLKDDG